MSFRTLHVAPESIVELVKSITAGEELVLAAESIPREAAIAGVRFDETSRTFEIDLVSRWPKDAAVDVDFKYSVRTGPDLGAPRDLGGAQRA